ncbi:hypothetical protein HDV02_003377 [Globomyces sp. JEL0801]|nr:hypothetical protein HDV02_003377 [Globomyces sp. JEL0801]
MDANGVPTSRVYCHATNSEMVYIRAVETKEMYRRQGYAQSMLHFALRDLFNQGFKRVVLQESEIGPEKLYLGIGFKKIGSCFECVYEKIINDYSVDSLITKSLVFMPLIRFIGDAIQEIGTVIDPVGYGPNLWAGPFWFGGEIIGDIYLPALALGMSQKGEIFNKVLV